MIPALSLQNFGAWAAQVAVILSIGMACPKVFRIHHPQSQLVYCYILLIVCITLPFVQPWQSAMPSAGASHFQSLSASSNVHAAEIWAPAVADIIGAGILVRLGF